MSFEPVNISIHPPTHRYLILSVLVNILHHYQLLLMPQKGLPGWNRILQEPAPSTETTPSPLEDYFHVPQDCDRVL